MALSLLCTTRLRISVSLLGEVYPSSGPYSLESQDSVFLTAFRSSPYSYLLGWPEFLGLSGPVLPSPLSFPAGEEDVMCRSLQHGRPLQELCPKPLAPHIPEHRTHSEAWGKDWSSAFSGPSQVGSSLQYIFTKKNFREWN